MNSKIGRVGPDRQARVMLSFLAEPGEPVLGALLRVCTPAEIAAAVGFLLDPVNSYIHGSVLFVDGGSDALLRPDGL